MKTQRLDLSLEIQFLNSGLSVNQAPVPGCLSRMFNCCCPNASTVDRDSIILQCFLPVEIGDQHSPEVFIDIVLTHQGYESPCMLDTH
jgi:hypothetical protein